MGLLLVLYIMTMFRVQAGKKYLYYKQYRGQEQQVVVRSSSMTPTAVAMHIVAKIKKYLAVSIKYQLTQQSETIKWILFQSLDVIMTFFHNESKYQTNFHILLPTYIVHHFIKGVVGIHYYMILRHDIIWQAKAIDHPRSSSLVG